MGRVYDQFKAEYRNSEHWITIDGETQSIDEITANIIDKIVAYENDVLPTVDFNHMIESLFIDQNCRKSELQ